MSHTVNLLTSYSRLRVLTTLSAIAFLCLLLSSCSDGSSSSPTLPPPSPPTKAQGTIGPAGGKVVISTGAQVIIPEDALAADTLIGVEQSASGAPPLPTGTTTFSPIVAFTPHGTNFALPTTITLPFDASSVPAGTKLALAKTNDTQDGWELISGSFINGNTISAPVVGFSYATVVADPSPLNDPPHLVTEQWHFENYYTGSTNPSKTEIVAFPAQESSDMTLRDGEPAGTWQTDSLGTWFDSRVEQVALHPRGMSDGAFGDVYSNQLGTTFWAESVAPMGAVQQPHTKIGRSATMTLTRVLRKTDDSAILKAVVSNIALDIIDTNSSYPSGAECPWAAPGSQTDPCYSSLVSQLAFKLDAWYTLPNGGVVSLRHVDASARLNGWKGHWSFLSGSTADSDAALFHQSASLFEQNAFDFDPNFDEGEFEHALVKLHSPELGPFKGGSKIPDFGPIDQVVDIPLDTVPRDGEFNVQITVTTKAVNRRQAESYVGTFLRDPAASSGVEFATQGVEVVRAPKQDVPQPPPPTPPVAAPACTTGTDPAAGVIQFDSDSIDGFEEAGATALIRVVRSGGSTGVVSVAFSAKDNTAHSGVDYTAVSTIVRFNDGEQGGRLITIPLIDNDATDGDRTVSLSLMQPMGCAALGPQSTATLIIHDDDKQTTTPTFHAGGTVTGLAGSGLVLQDVLSGNTVTPAADGTFVFPSTFNDGVSYDVRVETQPNNPAQNCSVTNGTGKIAGADVTNIAVTCTTLQSNGSLDPDFGDAGKVSVNLPPAKALALQSDGKLVVVGGMTLSRYNSDGTTDSAFGKNGSVTIVANEGPLDEMVAIALQPDGKIVVAGFTSLPTSVNDNFAVLRFNADGSPDTDFGTNGLVVTDFNGLFDRASAVLVQDDGKIVVAGHAASGTILFSDLDFAVVRYLSDGTLDPAFGTGGKATLNIAGKSDFSTTAALQSDGKILVAGRVFSDAGTEADIGLARFNADGTPDTNFGRQGIVRIDFSEGGIVDQNFSGGAWDEASRLAVRSDGKITIGGFTQIGGSYRYALVQLAADGSLDASFGTKGLASTPFTTTNDFARSMAIDAGGKIVVAGVLASTSTNPDMGIARYTSAGVLDTAFGTNGLVRIDFFGGFDQAADVVIQPDGRIVAAGSAINGRQGGLGMVRLIP